MRLLLIIFVVLPIACTRQQSADTSNRGLKTDAYPDTATISLAANLDYQADRYEDALEKYFALYEVDSTKGIYAYRMAYCLSELMRWAESAKYYKAAARLKYREFDCYFTLGVLYGVELQNDSLAVNYLEKALEIRPNDDEVRNLLQRIKKETELHSL